MPTFKITDLTTDIDLVYNSSTQKNYAAFYGIRIQAQDTEVLEHMPDDGPTQPIRAKDRDRTAYFDMNVYQGGDDEDEVVNKLITLKRWVDGADQQALRYQLSGDCDPIYLEVKPDDSMTNATLHEVKWGFVDDSGAYYSQYSDSDGKWMADRVMVSLRLAPYGEAETPITLKNDLTSSPHFVEDSNADGLADGWNETGTPTTTALDTTIWLIGGQSQKVITNDSDTEGIVSDAIGVTASGSVLAYVWLHIASGGDDVTVTLADDQATIEAKQMAEGDSGSVSDKSAVDSSGATWYRVEVSGAADGGASTATIDVSRDTGDAAANTTFYVDGCYLEDGGSVAPSAWMSARNIDNRNDIVDTSAATENYLNYIDVWGVPGDAPALVETELDFTTAAVGSNTLIIGRVVDGILLAADELHWIEDDDFTPVATNGAWTQPADAGRTEGQYRRFTDGGAATGSGDLDITLTGDSARALYYNPKRVYGIVRTSSLANDFTLLVTIQGTDIVLTNGPFDLPSGHADTWDIIDLGLLNLGGMFPLVPPDTTKPDDPIFTVRLTMDTVSSTADVDAVFLAAASAEFMVAKSGDDFPSNDVHIRGQERDIVDTVDGYNYKNRLGTMWELGSGNVMNRVVFCTYSSGGGHAPTDAAAIALTITPRTRHLLGTT